VKDSLIATRLRDIASALVLATFSMNSLRFAAIASNVAFISYAVNR
jgi:hypothetical protein